MTGRDIDGVEDVSAYLAPWLEPCFITTGVRCNSHSWQLALHILEHAAATDLDAMMHRFKLMSGRTTLSMQVTVELSHDFVATLQKLYMTQQSRTPAAPLSTKAQLLPDHTFLQGAATKGTHKMSQVFHTKANAVLELAEWICELGCMYVQCLQPLHRQS